MYNVVLLAITVLTSLGPVFLGSETLAIEPDSVTYDGSVLTAPYIKVGEIAYNVKLVPTAEAPLGAGDCPILCLKLLSADESQFSDARNPASFDGVILSTPRVVLGDEVLNGEFTYLSQYAPEVYFSVSAAGVAPLYSGTDRQNWTADQLEARFSFCQDNSYRWDTPFPFADFNNDGYVDILIPITCYQGVLPDNGGDNDVPIKSGWFLFCSDAVGRYANCSEELFGEVFIDTSKDGGKGGAPYHHSTEEPRDLNGDGFPDFALTLNRDDGVGRANFNPYTEEGFQQIVDQCFLGDLDAAEAYPRQGLGNCAYFSDQYMFLSNGDGSYSNVKVPWTPTWTHSMRSIPNDVGGYDVISIGYDVAKVARISGNTIEDVTEIYRTYENFSEATEVVPYVGGHFVFGNVSYWVTSGIKPQFVNNIAEYADYDISTGFYGTVRGITLWKWNPGQGFELSDYYIPSVADYFHYIDEVGNQATGLYQKGVPQFGKDQYHFFKKAELDPKEGPVLVVQGETSGLLEDFKRIIPNSFRVVTGASDSYEENTLYPVVPVEAFFITDGKLALRDKSVVEGDVLFNSSGMHFRDINLDGFDDLVTITGMKVQGGAYLNNGDGVLHRIDTAKILPELPRTSVGNNAHVFWPLRNNGTLDVIYMEVGANARPDYWSLPEDGIFRAGDVGVIRSNYDVSTLPLTTVEATINAFRECAKAPTWSWVCSY
ncbi:MAG TPA: hypothetical protein DEF79_03255 [Gammaproteobacteria bacterium]|nr:hypothetical protein [Gammaproteobacteria bacterium]|tara:strand:- start:1413 stop:3551 length:2139 start_codon:yes stop_codon:yes gene_type:complete